MERGGAARTGTEGVTREETREAETPGKTRRVAERASPGHHRGRKDTELLKGQAAVPTLGRWPNKALQRIAARWRFCLS